MFFKDIAKLFTTPPIQRIGFEDVLIAIKPETSAAMFSSAEISYRQYVLINTMDAGTQSALIPKTLPILHEEAKINEWIDKRDLNTCIIIYGRNATDDTADKKYNQLRGLGFSNIYVYSGGIFEWCLLQDIYGVKQFPTTCPIKDLLVYKSPSILNIQRIGSF